MSIPNGVFQQIHEKSKVLVRSILRITKHFRIRSFHQALFELNRKFYKGGV